MIGREGSYVHMASIICQNLTYISYFKEFNKVPSPPIPNFPVQNDLQPDNDGRCRGRRSRHFRDAIRRYTTPLTHNRNHIQHRNHVIILHRRQHVEILLRLDHVLPHFHHVLHLPPLRPNRYPLPHLQKTSHFSGKRATQ